jgi:hypothetical protein
MVKNELKKNKTLLLYPKPKDYEKPLNCMYFTAKC